MMSLTGMRGFSEPTGSWKMICIRRRSLLRSAPFFSKIVLAVKVGLATGGGQQADERPAKSGLAAAGLAHQAEDLALGDREADTVHGAHVADLALAGCRR